MSDVERALLFGTLGAIIIALVYTDSLDVLAIGAAMLIFGIIQYGFMYWSLQTAAATAHLDLAPVQPGLGVEAHGQTFLRLPVD